MRGYNRIRNVVNNFDMIKENTLPKKRLNKLRFNPKYKFIAELCKGSKTPDAIINYHS